MDQSTPTTRRRLWRRPAAGSAVAVRPGLRARVTGAPAALWRHRQPLLLLSIGVVVGLFPATFLGTLGHDGAVPQAAPTPVVTTEAAQPTAPLAAAPAAAAPAAATEPAGAAVPLLNGHVQPVEMAIPAIGVRSSFVNLGLNRDGSLQVPKDYDIAGWYAGGPAPGDAGGPPAIIAGHVDSKAGPGVFYRLRDLAVGAEVHVRGTDGGVRRFKVYKLATYPKNAFPDKQVYARSRTAEIRLITCTGAFDSTTGHYQGNLVAYASIVGA